MVPGTRQVQENVRLHNIKLHIKDVDSSTLVPKNYIAPSFIIKLKYFFKRFGLDDLQYKTYCLTGIVRA